MLKIALCDDDATQRDVLKDLLRDYNSVSPFMVESAAFCSGAELLNAVKQNGRYDIYILDVMMPEMDGLALAGQLREGDDAGKIVFLSAEPSFVYKAFSVSASGYLVKPVDPEELFSLIDTLHGKIEKERPSFVLVKTENGERRIEVRDILYVDTYERMPVFHMTDGADVLCKAKRVKFQEQVSSLLRDYPFALSSVGVAVNLANVKSIRNESSEITLNNGKILLCSRTMKESFVRSLESYWNE